MRPAVPTGTARLPAPRHNASRGSGESNTFLQSDGYSAYHVRARHDAVRGQMACWAHVRRGFVDAAKARQRTGAAHQMVAMIGKLYQVEHELKELTPKERSKRAPDSRPHQGWLDSKAEKALPKAKLGEAIR